MKRDLEILQDFREPENWEVDAFERTEYVYERFMNFMQVLAEWARI